VQKDYKMSKSLKGEAKMNSFGNKLGLLCVVLALFATAGCGKKNDKKTVKTDSKKMASATIPTLEEESESFLDEDAVSDLAFVDDANTEKKDNKDTVLASADELPSEFADQETASEYPFKAIHFGFNENSIREDQDAVVTSDCELAQNAVEAGKQVVVQGHTCQVGSASYNLALSQRRAESVKAEMVEAGIAADSIKTVGYGYEMPLVWSEKKDRSSLIKELSPNRRAEVLVN